MRQMNHAKLGLGGSGMLQVAHRSHTQMMSFLIETPDAQWLYQVAPARFHFLELFREQIEKYQIPVITPRAGDVLDCGGVMVEIVSHPEEYRNYPTINATSMIVLLHFPGSVFNNMLVKPDNDMTRFVRQIKSVLGTEFLDDFIEEQIDLAEQVAEVIPEQVTDAKIIQENVRRNEQMKEKLSHSNLIWISLNVRLLHRTVCYLLS